MKQEYAAFVVFLIATIFISYFLQNQMFLSADVSYLLHVTKQLINGGTYFKDFFETNPPMILYLYLPVCFLQKTLHISIENALRFVIILEASISLITCYFLLKRIFKRHEFYQVFALLIAISFVLFYQPAYQFGQREHIFMIVMLPYTFLVLLNIEGKKVHCLIKWALSFFVAMGLALKPFFLFPFILIEFYIIYRKRSLFAFVRTEPLIILSVLLIYSLSIFIFHPNYFKYMLPFIGSFYFFGYQDSWFDVFFNYVTTFCAMSVAIYFLFRKADKQRTLTTVLLLAMLGMVLAFMVPRMIWSYHVMPAIGFATILLTYYFVEILKTSANAAIKRHWLNKGCDIFFFASIFGIFFAFPLYLDYFYYHYFIVEKKVGDRIQLMHYLETLPAPYSLTCLSTFTTTCFPLSLDKHIIEDRIGRFPFFWWILGMLKWDNLSKDALPSEILQLKHVLFKEFITDMKRFKPTIVVIQKMDDTSKIAKNFNYIDYFSTDKNFAAEWKNYHFLKNIAYYEIYKRNTKE